MYVATVAHILDNTLYHIGKYRYSAQLCYIQQVAYKRIVSQCAVH